MDERAVTPLIPLFGTLVRDHNVWLLFISSTCDSDALRDFDIFCRVGVPLLAPNHCSRRQDL